MPIAALIAEQNGTLVRIHDDNVHVAIVIVVCTCRCAPDECLGKIGTGSFRYLIIGAIAVVSEDLVALRVRLVVLQDFNDILRMPIRTENIEVSIVIVIQKEGTEPDKRQRRLLQAAFHGSVRKEEAFFILIERRLLRIRYDKIEPAIAVIVAAVNPH